MILLVSSHQKFWKGPIKLDLDEGKFLYLHLRDALQIQKCIFWAALCVKMHDFCVNAIPEHIIPRLLENVFTLDTQSIVV